MIENGFVADQSEDIRKPETLCICEQSTHLLFAD